MKILFITLSTLALTNAYAERCRVMSSCIKKISSCKLYQDEADYSPSSGRLEKTSYFAWERKDALKCFREAPSEQILNDVTSASAELYIKELRIPDSVEDVPEKYLLEINRRSLRACEIEKELLTTTYSFCE